MNNEVATKEVYQTSLTKLTNTFMPQVEQQLVGNGIEMTDYQKMCVMGAVQAIDVAIGKSKKSWGQTDMSNVSNVLLSVAALQLNASAVPNEVYFITRNTQVDGNWVNQLEMGIEGDGNDAILSKFGRNVKRVHRFWEVKEGDDFSYPTYKGIEMVPPEWSPKGQGKVIRVVYPIEMAEGIVEYHIAERGDVVRNLIAHINQNLMNETFGILTGNNSKGKPKTRYDATPEELKKINAKKKELMAKLEGRTLDELIVDKEFEPYISPAWKSPQSRESMIVRKMRNNVVKKIPKNFENAFVAMTYQEQDDEVTSRVRKDVTENSASEMYDFETEDVTVEQEEAGTVKEAEFKETEEATPIKKDEIQENVIQGDLIDLLAEKEEGKYGF